MRALTTIDEHNRRVLKASQYKNLTGIACPRCSEELQFDQPDILMLTNPPQQSVKCFACNYKTSVYV